MEQIRLRAGQAKNMTCERSANSQPSNPEGVRPKRSAPAWVQNPGQCMGKAADQRGKPPSRRPKPTGLTAHKDRNDQTCITPQPDDRPGAGQGRAPGAHQALTGPEMARNRQGGQVQKARAVRRPTRQPSGRRLHRPGNDPGYRPRTLF